MESANLYSRNAGNEEHNKPKNRYKNILPCKYHNPEEESKDR